MRIGFDAKRALHNQTGLGNYSRDVIRLFTQNKPNDEFFLFDPVGKGIHFDYNLFNTHVIHSQRRSGLGKNIWRQYGLKREIQSLHLDVYHGLSNELPMGIEKTTVKTLVTVHDIIFEKHPEWYQRIDRTIYRNKTKRAIQVADLVIAISEQTKQDLIDVYKADAEKIKVVYQGCNPVFFEKQSEESLHSHLRGFNLPDHFVLYVGTIEERKNLHRLVLAMADLNIPLVTVGRKTDYYNKVQSALKGTGLANQFYHLSDLTQQQLAALYQKARLFVYPSLYEGFGIPIIEALHSGTPVITGNGCLKEAAGPGGIFVDVKNVEEIKAALLNAWYDDVLLDTLRYNGYEHVKQFKDDVLWQKWNEIYALL